MSIFKFTVNNIKNHTGKFQTIIEKNGRMDL